MICNLIFVSGVPKTVLLDHISKSGHKASFDDFKIISKTDNHFELLIHESLLIKRDMPSLNSQTSSIPMVLF